VAEAGPNTTEHHATRRERHIAHHQRDLDRRVASLMVLNPLMVLKSRPVAGWLVA